MYSLETFALPMTAELKILPGMFRETPSIPFKRLVLALLTIYVSLKIEFIPIYFQSRTD